MKIVAFTPIRLDSKRVKLKSLRLLGERPLLNYQLHTVTNLRHVANFVYSSCPSTIRGFVDDPDIANRVNWLERPAELDGDEVLGVDIYSKFVDTIQADAYILYHVTSPFLKADTYRRGLRALEEGHDSACTVVEVKSFAHYMGKPLNFSAPRPRTQDLEPVLVETSGFYMFTRKCWEEQHSRTGPECAFITVDKIEAMDIDTEQDLEICSKMMEF